MKNITVTVDDRIYRRARIKAAEQDTSVSAMVRTFLESVAGEESATERLKREERALREQVGKFSASENVSRDELHRRGG